MKKNRRVARGRDGGSARHGARKRTSTGCFDYAKQGYTHFVFHEYDTNWDGKAYQTVSGQNSTTASAFPNAFFDALERDGDWGTAPPDRRQGQQDAQGPRPLG